jgi:ankyrin repeat protein
MGHIKTVERLLKANADVNYQNKAGNTPVYLASIKGHAAIVRLLIRIKADVNICNKDGISPVYAASRTGRTGIVDLLVNAGADIHLAATDSCGDVPLGIAIRMGHIKTVERLLKANADVNYQNKAGNTPVYLASIRGLQSGWDMSRLLKGY